MACCVRVYYDYLDDFYCYTKEYHFDTEENARGFQEQAVEAHEMVFVAEIEKKKNQSPEVFTSVQDAVGDLKMFLARGDCSMKHFYKTPLVYLQLLFYQSECAHLEEENRELRMKLEEKETR